MNLRVFATWVGLAAGSVSASWGQTTVFTASMDGAQVPFATSGTGTASLTLTNATGAWTLSGSFSNLTGTASVVHIHGPAAPGSDAGVQKGLSFVTGAGTTSGTFEGGSASTGVFSSAQMSDLLAGLYYVNLHTSVAGGGEIRGQLTAIPEPGTYAMVIGVAALGVIIARRGRRPLKKRKQKTGS